MGTNIKVLWDLVWENIDSPRFKLLIVMALIISIGYVIVNLHISNQNYKARKIESDNLLKIEMVKSHNEFMTRKYESDILLKIELSKRNHKINLQVSSETR